MDTRVGNMICFLSLVFAVRADVTSLDSSEDQPINCDLDHDLYNPDVAKCLKIGERFFYHYHKKLMKNRMKDFDRCSEYVEFKECLEPFMVECPNVKTMLTDRWQHIWAVMDCSCGLEQENCLQSDLLCVEDELTGIFARRCEKYHKFNMEQKTRHECHFMQLELECKQGLVESSCGSRAGAFSSAWSQILARKKTNCNLIHNRNHNAFTYTDACPRTLTEEIKKCSKDTFGSEDGQISFYETNNLISEHRKKHVKKACSAYKTFRKCIRPVRERCENGYDYVLQMHGDLTLAYIMKMDFICREVKDDYIDNLPCYQEVHLNETIKSCQHLWNKIAESHKAVSAVQFFCQTGHKEREVLVKDLDDVRQCYEDKFTSSCGSVGGKTMGKFIEQAFTNHIYLRYKFKPDCELHGFPEQPGHGHTNPPEISTVFRETSPGIQLYKTSAPPHTESATTLPSRKEQEHNAIEKNLHEQKDKSSPVLSKAVSLSSSTYFLCFGLTVYMLDLFAVR